MDIYLAVKYLHIIFAIVWLGGGFAMVFLAARANRAKDDTELVHVVQDVIYLAGHLFVPSSLLAFVFGAAAAWLNWTFDLLWINIGIVGFILTFVTGIFILTPRANKVGALFKEQGISPEVVGRSRQILRIAQFDFVMLYIVVADMVLKPTAEDVTVLVIMAAVLAAGAIIFLPRARLPARAG